MYACGYLATDLPFDTPLRTRAALSDPRTAGSATWLGGSTPRPPAGRRREILNGDLSFTLCVAQPHDTARFEMRYSGRP